MIVETEGARVRMTYDPSSAEAEQADLLILTASGLCAFTVLPEEANDDPND